MSTITYESNFNYNDCQHYPAVSTLNELTSLPEFDEKFKALVKAKVELDKAKVQTSEHDSLIKRRVFSILGSIINIPVAIIIIAALAGAMCTMPVGGAILTVLIGFTALPIASVVGEVFLIIATTRLFLENISRKTDELEYAKMMHKIQESDMDAFLEKNCGRKYNNRFRVIKEFVTRKVLVETSKTTA
jgi:hypothetical protein